MESEEQHTWRADAAEQLRQHDHVRDQAEQHGPSRSFAHLGLGVAVAAAVYLAVLLFSFGTFDARAAGGSTYVQTTLVPVLLSGPLLNGAAQRFSVRIRATPRLWIIVTILLAAFLTLSSLSIYGVGYPLWLNAIFTAGLFIAVAAQPIRQLRRPVESSATERWVNQPLSRPARRMTILIGVALALIVGTSPQSWYPLVSTGVMFAFLVLVLAWNAPWGVHRTGYEWGPLHWWGFALTMAVVFTMTILLAGTDWVSTALSVIAGVLVLVVMVTVALLPTRARET